MEIIELDYFDLDNTPKIEKVKLKNITDYNNLLDIITRKALYITDIKNIKLKTLQKIIKDFYVWKQVESISDFKHSQYSYRILKANAYDLIMEVL